MSKSTHEIEVEIRNPEGLHMRPAMQFVDLANSFDSDISVSHQDVSVDAKSIMQMTMLAATCGTRLKITATGADAGQAIQALQDLVENKFSDDPEAAVSEKEG
ncbi:MAG: HPr family phosphocarrier protein [Planctomycetota bacterium]